MARPRSNVTVTVAGGPNCKHLERLDSDGHVGVCVHCGRRLPGNVGKPVFILTAGSFAVVEPQPCIIRLTTGIDPNAVEDVPL